MSACSSCHYLWAGKKIVIIVRSHFSLQEYLKSCTSCTSLKNQLLYKFLTSALISTLGHDDNMTKWRILLEFVWLIVCTTNTQVAHLSLLLQTSSISMALSARDAWVTHFSTTLLKIKVQRWVLKYSQFKNIAHQVFFQTK